MMKLKKHSHIVFWIGYAMLIGYHMFSNVVFLQPYLDRINIVGTALVVIFMIYINLAKIPLMKNPKHYILMALLFAISIIGRNLTGNFTFFKLLAIGYSLYGVSLQNFIKKDFYIKCAMFLMVLFFLATGMCEITQSTRFEKIRYTLGFIHPNTAGFFLMILPMEYVYVFKKQKPLVHISIIIAAALICNFVLGSRSAVFCLLIFLIFYVISMVIKKNKNMKAYRIFSMLPFVLAGFSFLITFLYQQGAPGLYELNNALSYRPHYALDAITYYPFMLFGSSLPQDYVLDNAYIYYAISLGILAFLCYMFLLSCTIYKVGKQGDKIMVIAIIVTLIYGLVEKTALMATFNPFILSVFLILFSFVNRDKKDKNVLA